MRVGHLDGRELSNHFGPRSHDSRRDVIRQSRCHRSLQYSTTPLSNTLGKASYEDDGVNTAHNPRDAVIGRFEGDNERTGRPTPAIRTFGLNGRKAKIRRRVEKFLTMCPAATDDDALSYAPSRARCQVESEVSGRPPFQKLDACAISGATTASPAIMPAAPA